MISEDGPSHPRFGERSSVAAKSLGRAFHGPVTIGLLLTDAVLILLHAGWGFLFLSGTVAAFPDLVRIDRDWGVAEIMAYVKWLALAAMSVLLFRRCGAGIFLAIAVMAVVALLVDSLQLHEGFGNRIAPHLSLPSGSAEVVFILLEGALIAGLLLHGWFKATRTVRRQVVPVLLLMGGAVFCAAGVDFLHSQLPGNSMLAGMFGILEDGGEMVFLSLILGYVAHLMRRTGMRTGIPAA